MLKVTERCCSRMLVHHSPSTSAHTLSIFHVAFYICMFGRFSATLCCSEQSLQQVSFSLYTLPLANRVRRFVKLLMGRRDPQ